MIPVPLEILHPIHHITFKIYYFLKKYHIIMVDKLYSTLFNYGLNTLTRSHNSSLTGGSLKELHPPSYLKEFYRDFPIKEYIKE